MVAIQVRDVPEELRDVLARDARARGQSLQAYLLEVLRRQGDAARNAEFLRTWEPVRPSARAGRVDVVETLHEVRVERDRQLLGDHAKRSS